MPLSWLNPAPLTPAEAETIVALVEADGSLFHAARDRGIGAHDLLALISRPAALEALESLRALNSFRRELRNEAIRDELVAVLRDVARAAPDHTAKRLAASTALRALSRSTQLADPPWRNPARSTGPRIQEAGLRTPRRPRRIADFNLGPEQAEAFLERERRENDRLERLIQRTLELARNDSGPSPQPEGGPSPEPGPREADAAHSTQDSSLLEPSDPRSPGSSCLEPSDPSVTTPARCSAATPSAPLLAVTEIMRGYRQRTRERQASARARADEQHQRDQRRADLYRRAADAARSAGRSHAPAAARLAAAAGQAPQPSG